MCLKRRLPGISLNSSYAGGIAGHVENYSTLGNNYSIGNISSNANANVSSALNSSYAGGLAGMVSLSTIVNSAAVNDRIIARGYAGRVAGYINNDGGTVVSNNFALNTMQATGIAEFYITDTGRHGISRTDVQLRTHSTYSDSINGNGLGGLGWKFGNNADNPWKMTSGVGYPILYWQ